MNHSKLEMSSNDILNSKYSPNYKKQGNFQNLQLIKLANFKNNQINGVFNDNTTIIIHPDFGNSSLI